MVPNFRDMLPQPPWEGPPVPRAWLCSAPSIRDEIEQALNRWAKQYDVSKPRWSFTMSLRPLYVGEEKTIYIPDEYLRLYEISKSVESRRPLKHYLAHEFAHHVFNEQGRSFQYRFEEEDEANRIALKLTGIDREDALLELRELSPELYYQRF